MWVLGTKNASLHSQHLSENRLGIGVLAQSSV